MVEQLFKVIERDVYGNVRQLDNTSADPWTETFTKSQAEECVAWREQHITRKYWYEIVECPPLVGAQRACPDCGRPQHYTGTENGWAHDATVDTWDCADPRKAPADRRLISHLTRGCTCDHRPGDPCNASCPVHLGAGLRSAEGGMYDPRKAGA